jgi:regulation of enolase protein 1 (concanavalin A-like superfamily)
MKRSMIPILVLALSVGSIFCQADDNGPHTLPGWGTTIDPDGDCQFLQKDSTLQILVPATIHDLNPWRGQNAPRVVARVAGDFAVQVKVTGEFLPGMTSAGKGAPFNGAGILIWENDRNYVRIERDAYWASGMLMCYPPLMEYWHKGRYSGANEEPASAEYFQGNSTWLKAERRGKMMTVSISHDGLDWKLVKNFPVELADENLVGVAALNTSDLPFTVEFSDFSIERF